MLKSYLTPQQIIFDIETVPDLETARRVYPVVQMTHDRLSAEPGISPESIDRGTLESLYQVAGATKQEPKPFLKYFVQRVVSICGIARSIVEQTDDNPIGIKLEMFTLPRTPNGSEADIINPFLLGIGKKKPTLVGFCSTLFDLPCLNQRALINRLHLPEYCNRPNKPWEGADYWAKGSDYNLDLLDLLASYSGNSKMTLDELARSLRIPGKIGVGGSDVADLWFSGKHEEIIRYNETDTATTYLIWIEFLHLAGHITSTDREIELAMFRNMIRDRISSGASHFEEFLNIWDHLNDIPSSESATQNQETDKPDADPESNNQ